MDIVWEKYQNISLYLRNMDYSTIYDEIEKNHNYNVKLPDGGIIQLMYRFNRIDFAQIGVLSITVV